MEKENKERVIILDTCVFITKDISKITEFPVLRSGMNSEAHNLISVVTLFVATLIQYRVYEKVTSCNKSNQYRSIFEFPFQSPI